MDEKTKAIINDLERKGSSKHIVGGGKEHRVTFVDKKEEEANQEYFKS